MLFNYNSTLACYPEVSTQMRHCRASRWLWTRCLGWVLLPVVLLVSGCAGDGPVRLSGDAAAILNRDSRGKPLSVVVRVYQLKSDQAFKRLSIEALASGKPEKDLLSPDLVALQELTLLPGAKAEIADFVVLPESTHIGLVALFRQPDRQFWRLLFDADAVRSKGLQFHAEDCYLRALKPAARLMPGQPGSLQVECR